MIRRCRSTLLGLAVALGSSAGAGPLLAIEDTAAFRSRQKELLKAQDPDRIRIDRAPAPQVTPEAVPQELDSLGRPKPASLSVSVSELAAAAQRKKAEPGILDFWVEGRFQPYTAGVADGSLSVMTAGTKYMLGPDIMIGALAQLDRGIEDRIGTLGSPTSNGWMAGPYASIRFGAGIVLDGRVAWGAGEIEDVQETDGGSDRRLIKGTLRGTRQVGGWSVTPKVGVTYLEETPERVKLDTEPGAEIVSSGEGRVEVLPEVKRRFDVGDATFVEPRASAGAFVTFDEFSKLNGVAVEGLTPDVRMKAEAGVAVGVKDGAKLEALGGVEAAGEAAPEVWSGRLQLNVPLGK